MSAERDDIREAARSIRRCHLQLFAAQWREARQEYEAAKRSRQARARVIRLARAHHLAAVLKTLRAPGMTLCRGRERSHLNYDYRATRHYRSGLVARMADARQQARTCCGKEVLANIEANLATLFHETEPSREFKLGVCWTMEDVTLEDVWIGDLEVHLNLEQFQSRVRNTSQDSSSRRFPHPHVARILGRAQAHAALVQLLGREPSASGQAGVEAVIPQPGPHAPEFWFKEPRPHETSAGS